MSKSWKTIKCKIKTFSKYLYPLCIIKYRILKCIIKVLVSYSNLCLYRLIFCGQLFIHFIFIEMQNHTTNNMSHNAILRYLQLVKFIIDGLDMAIRLVSSWKTWFTFSFYTKIKMKICRSDRIYDLVNQWKLYPP